MAELVPYPFGRLVSRIFRELERERAIFDLPEKKFVRGLAGKDLSVALHGHHASSPLGPAAGPHSQLAQNIVLAFLGGARIFELKTVQIMDRLKIPRPCIDAQTIGYNVEWSQELRLEQSLEEYVKASMLVDMLVSSGKLGLLPGFDRVLFDMSVGYDLGGIQSERVRPFLDGMMDASALVESLRRQIPDEQKQLRDVEYRTRISRTLTLSTFHGCPPDEIERITEFLLERIGLDCIVKLNPTLLGKSEVRRLLNDVLGYADRVPDEAFDKDASWQQAVDFIGRLGDKARSLGRGFGVKCTNTLIVENSRSFFPGSEKVMYLSGQPLHVLAMSLVGKLRSTFGDRVPISFSGGIDQKNFPDAVALGLVPVTVCTDLLRPGGYGRMQGYFKELSVRMEALGATSVNELVLRTAGLPALSEARLANTRAYLERLVGDPRFGRASTDKPPKKVGSRLVLFDCLTCDKCIPVCPNDANFAYALPSREVPIRKARASGDGSFSLSREGQLRIEQKHQIANFADFCNECGNCDVFCPEDGGPYVLKPRFFGNREQFDLYPNRDGFCLERDGERLTVLGRFAGRSYRAVFDQGMARFSGEGFSVSCRESDPIEDLQGEAETGIEIDLTYVSLMSLLGRAVLDGGGINYLNV